jgi:hypothetical protein
VGISEQGSQGTMEQIKEQVGGTARVVTSVAGSVFTDRIKAEVSARSAQAAVEMKAAAQAMREAGRSLREQGHQTQASFAEDAAGRADRMAAHLASADAATLVADAKRWSYKANAFIREEPFLVSAAAFTVGLLATRWLRGTPAES